MQSKVYFFSLLFSLALLMWQCSGGGDNTPAPVPDGLSLSSFAPTRDTVGATVVLTGAGFSATAAQNIVKFNNLTAEVVTASANSLTVKVPQGATKGKISIQVEDKTTVSTEDFTVTGWTRKADFGGAARINGSGFVLNGKIYYGLGVKGFAGANVLGGADFWEYDPATNAWIQKASHPAINDGAGSAVESQPVSFAINGKGYVALGSLRAVWEYDPTANTWTKKNENHPLGTSVSLQSAVAFVVSGKAYIVGGNNGTARRELYEYDPVANTWTKKADFPNTSGIYRTQGFAIGNKGYVGAGVVGSGTRKFWEYNTTNNTWAEVASYPGNNAADAVTTTFNGMGYVLAGNGSTGLYEYNPTTNTWATQTYKPTFRFARAFTLEEQIYWLGGGGLTKEFWVYLP